MCPIMSALHCVGEPRMHPAFLSTCIYIFKRLTEALIWLGERAVKLNKHRRRRAEQVAHDDHHGQLYGLYLGVGNGADGMGPRAVIIGGRRGRGRRDRRRCGADEAGRRHRSQRGSPRRGPRRAILRNGLSEMPPPITSAAAAHRRGKGLQRRRGRRGRLSPFHAFQRRRRCSVPKGGKRDKKLIHSFHACLAGLMR